MLQLKSIYGKIFAAVIFAGIIIFASQFITNCVRTKQITKQAEKIKIVYVQDSIGKALSAKYRAREDSIIKSKDLALLKERTRLKGSKIADSIVVVKYIKDPTVANCNEVIESKDRVINIAEKIIINQDSIRFRLNNVITSYKSDSVQARETIHKLVVIANENNALAQKYSKKLNKRFVLSVGPGYGYNADLKRGFSVNVNLGLKIASF